MLETDLLLDDPKLILIFLGKRQTHTSGAYTVVNIVVKSICLLSVNSHYSSSLLSI